MGFGSKSSTPVPKDPVPVPVEDDIAFVEAGRNRQRELEDQRGASASLLVSPKGVQGSPGTKKKSLGAGAQLI